MGYDVMGSKPHWAAKSHAGQISSRHDQGELGIEVMRPGQASCMTGKSVAGTANGALGSASKAKWAPTLPD